MKRFTRLLFLGLVVGFVQILNIGYVLADRVQLVPGLEVRSTGPIITMYNTTAEDSDWGRESYIKARGTQSGAEVSTLGELWFGHDGASDDEKGQFRIKLNIGGLLATKLDLDSDGLTVDTLDTGLGENELYDMNQNVMTSSIVSFLQMVASQSATIGSASNKALLHLYGGSAGGTQGATIYLYMNDDYDSNSDYWLNYISGEDLHWYNQDLGTSMILDLAGDLTVYHDLTVSGAATISGNMVSSGTLSGTSLDTGQGAHELYAMNQDVEDTDAVTFLTVDTGQGAYELYAMDQDVRENDSPTFNLPTFTNGAIIGSEGGGGKVLSIKGSDAPGTDYGGGILLYNANDYDGTFEYWTVQVYEDDLNFTTSNISTSKMLLTPDGDLTINGDLTVGQFVQFPASSAPTCSASGTTAGIVYYDLTNDELRVCRSDGTWDSLD